MKGFGAFTPDKNVCYEMMDYDAFTPDELLEAHVPNFSCYPVEKWSYGRQPRNHITPGIYPMALLVWKHQDSEFCCCESSALGEYDFVNYESSSPEDYEFVDIQVSDCETNSHSDSHLD